LKPRALQKTVETLVTGGTWSPETVAATQPMEDALEIEGSAAAGVGGDSEAVRPGSPTPN
jgi:hypothetical protein